MTLANSMIHPLFLNLIQVQMIRKKQMMILVTLETLTSRNHRCHLQKILKSKIKTMMMILEISVILISLKPKRLLFRILMSTRKMMTTSAILENSINLKQKKQPYKNLKRKTKTKSTNLKNQRLKLTLSRILRSSNKTMMMILVTLATSKNRRSNLLQLVILRNSKMMTMMTLEISMTSSKHSKLLPMQLQQHRTQLSNQTKTLVTLMNRLQYKTT